jgi:hypothetical protein
MSTYYNSPCRELSTEQRAHRLACYLWDKPERETRAGVCQVCGHALPVSYRAVKATEGAANEVIETPAGSEQEKAIRAKIASGSIWDAFERTGWTIFDCRSCDAITPEVWTWAKRINDEKKRERAAVGKSAPAQPEPAPKQPRKFSNFPQPLSREQLTA